MTSGTIDAAGLIASTGLEATYRHIMLLNRKREQLHAAQIAAEEQFLCHVARNWQEGKLSEPELARVFGAYVQGAAPGYEKRWKTAVPVHPKRLANLLRQLGRGEPNMPDGTWRGSWPLDEGAPLPPNGTCVVYVLYDEASQPCYAGSSQNLRARLRRHRMDGKGFTCWTAFACTDREAAYQLEGRLLSEYLPYLNKKRGR